MHEYKGTTSNANLDITTFLSIVFQRLNSEMILLRLPRDKALVFADLTVLNFANRRAVQLAREGPNVYEEWKKKIKFVQDVSELKEKNRKH